jgi:hypothetical protein
MVILLSQQAALNAFAIAMLGVIAISLGIIALLFLCMKHSAARRDPHVDALLEELEHDERNSSRPAPRSSPPAPWERSADWWK